MPKLPDLGLHYEDVRDKLKKYESVKTNPWLKNSLKNQARLAEGEGVLRELDDEFDGDSSRVGISFSGVGDKQVGIGNGKCDPSKSRTMIFKDGKWIEED